MGLQVGGEKQTYFQTRDSSFEYHNSEPIFCIDNQGTSLTYGKDYTAYPGRNYTSGIALRLIKFITRGKDGKNILEAIKIHPRLYPTSICQRLVERYH